MGTRVVEYQDSKLKVRLVVQEANALIGMRRALLRGGAEGYLKIQEAQIEGERPKSVKLAALRLVARMQYPDLLAATVEAEGVDPEMEIESFLDLPDRLVIAWENAVYELNPHWLGLEPGEAQGNEDEAAQKKGGRKGGATSGVG
ncbi:MAG: hypothetical protein JXB35_10445 [Anaerolineae bacterium]|nr:hypothetical protein [Anaerolineae bacterium]